MTRLLPVNEVATLLRVSRGRAYELVRIGLLPCVRIGRQLRISEAALERFIEQGGRGLDENGDHAPR